jgi:hypothetical protein
VFKPSRKFKFGKNRTNRGITVPKHLQQFISTLATGIAMTAVDSNRYLSELRVV